MFEAAVFWFFAVILVIAAICVITARNPVHSALFLVLAFFTAAGLWMLLRAEFLAIALVLVYVGAVMVLFLFVVMMLDVNLEQLRAGFWGNLPLALAVGAVMVVEMIAIIVRGFVETRAPGDPGSGYSNTKALGLVLYTDYAYAFEIAAVRRSELERKSVAVSVEGGTVRVKVGLIGDRIVSATPEHDDVAELASRSGRAVRDVYEEAAAAARTLRYQAAERS